MQDKYARAFGYLESAVHRALRELAEWQPIETAPKDGRWILLYVPDPGSHLVPCGVVPAKWVSGTTFAQGWTTRGVCGIDASHWMPLPKEPNVENAASGILKGALRDLQFNHGIELNFPDDVKDVAAQLGKEQARCEGYQFSRPQADAFFCGRAEFHGRHFFVRPDDVKENEDGHK